MLDFLVVAFFLSFTTTKLHGTIIMKLGSCLSYSLKVAFDLDSMGLEKKISGFSSSFSF